MDLTPSELAALDAVCVDPNKAMKAFYGAPDAPRVQEVFTPLELVAPLISVWGGIGLDPCSHPDSPVPAEAKWQGTVTKLRKGVPVEWEGPGRSTPWVDRTYCNPPFSELEEWCAHAACQPHVRWALLCPARLQRKWLRRLMRGRVVIALDSVCFEGYDQAFPQALVLIVNGYQADIVAKAYERAGIGERLC